MTCDALRDTPAKVERVPNPEKKCVGFVDTTLPARMTLPAESQRAYWYTGLASAASDLQINVMK